jgi:hypothetical protein
MLFRNDSLNIHFQMRIKENMCVKAFSHQVCGLFYKTRTSVITYNTCTESQARYYPIDV